MALNKSHALWLLALAPRALGAPAAEGPAQPMITPAPDINQRAVPLQRDLKDLTAPASYLNSVWDSLGSGVSSYVISGVPQYFQDFPGPDQVKSKLSINDGDLDAKPTQVLNLPPYANWTDQGWNVRVHGNVYKIPDISESKVDDLANVFLIDTSVDELPEDQAAQARNVTRSIYVVQQKDEDVEMSFINNVNIRPNASGGVHNADAGSQSIKLPYKTTLEGDFDAFVQLKNTSNSEGKYLLPGNETSSIQALNVYTNGTDTGNATAYLVPPKGLTVISDIDDILRVTKIYVPKEGLLNSFARPFTPWMNMPDIYANWSASIPNFHFHYLTTTPEQITRNYMDFIYQTYPLGSFDTRPLNFSDVSATLSIRKFLLDRIFQTFPERKFVLMGDTTNSDVMKDYPQLAKDYPGQVQCIFLRNTTATDSSDLFPYDTSGFEGLDQKQYMFFLTPNDLRNVDIEGGNCYNEAVVQNVTFGYQGRGFGNDKDESGAAALTISHGRLLAGAMLLASFFLVL